MWESESHYCNEETEEGERGKREGMGIVFAAAAAAKIVMRACVYVESAIDIRMN